VAAAASEGHSDRSEGDAHADQEQVSRRGRGPSPGYRSGVPAPADPDAAVLVPLTLITGEEELLVSRAVARIVAAARGADTDTDVRDLQPDAVDLADLLDLLSPSLFGSLRVVILRDAGDLEREVLDALVAYVAHPEPEVVLVAMLRGAKGKALADALRAGGARVVDCPRVRWPEERLAFLRAEVTAAGRRASDAALQTLLDAVGQELRELATALDQLLSDTEGPLDDETVARYHRGRAVASGFLVADRAIDGDAAGALELLRAGLAGGFADGSFVVRPEGVPVVVAAALASGLRDIVRVKSAGGPPGDLARSLGMAPFKIRKARAQGRDWHPDGLRRAVAAAARADADAKGGAADPAYALERAVLAVVAARDVR
jgi:DNA polymerase III subunit delta